MKQTNKLDALLRGGLDTATFGVLPKVHGLLDAATKPRENKNETFAEAYKRERDIRRLRNIEAFEENPKSYLSGGLAGALLGPAPGFLKGTKTSTLAPRIAKGAAGGALYGAGASDEGEIGEYNTENALDTLYGGIAGGVGATVIPPIVNTAGRAINKLTPDFIKEGITKGTAKLADYLGAPEAPQQALKAISPNHITPQQREISDLAKNAMYMEKGNLARPAIDKLQQQESATKELASAAYEQAKSKVGSLDIKQIKQFAPQMREALVAESIDPSTHKKTYAYIKNFNNILDKEAPKNAVGVDFQRLEGWRKQLGKAISREPDEAEKYGLIRLKKGYDDFLDSNIEKAMLNGDSEVLKAYEGARSGWSNYKQTYNPQHPHEYGKKFIQDIIKNVKSNEPYTDEMIANKIFGANEIGFKPQSSAIIKELKAHVGSDSPEMHALRLEGAKKILNPLLTSGENKAAAIEKYNMNLKKQLPILRELLPQEMVNELQSLGEKGSNLYKPGQKLTAETFEKMKYIGPTLKAINSQKNLVESIYNKGNSDYIPVALGRTISQSFIPESQEEQVLTKEAPEVEAPQETDYNDFISKLSPEQLQQLEDLKQSMHPIQ